MITRQSQYANLRKSLCLISAGAMTIIGLSGCLGGSGSGGGSATRTGVFTDSPVAGLRYHTATQEGITAADGTFRYRDGETVTFHLGELQLGSATAAEQLSPLDLVDGAEITDSRVTNMLVLLQSLDEDRALNNGIQISAAIADAVSLWADSILFDQDPASFASSTPIQSLLADLNAA